MQKIPVFYNFGRLCCNGIVKEGLKVYFCIWKFKIVDT
jgi:hypothetical protein